MGTREKKNGRSLRGTKERGVQEGGRREGGREEEEGRQGVANVEGVSAQNK